MNDPAANIQVSEQTIDNRIDTDDEYPSWNEVPYAVQEIMRKRCSVATVEKCADDNMFLYCDYDFSKYLEMPKWSLEMAFSLLSIAQVEGSKYESIEACSAAEESVKVSIGHEYCRKVFEMPLKDCLDKLGKDTVVPSTFIRGARAAGYTLPPLWSDFVGLEGELGPTEKDAIALKKALRINQLAKIKCQAIASTLWHLNPSWTIEQIIKHHAILEFGDGKDYVDKKTLREWVKEVDPRSPESKIGRPKKMSSGE